MRKKVCISLAVALFFMSCTAPAAGYFSGPETVLAAEEIQETKLILNDLSRHEKELEEEIKYLNESFDESPQWKEGAYILSEEEYPGSGRARYTYKYVKEEYGIDIYREVNKLRYILLLMYRYFVWFYDGRESIYE